MPIGDKMMYSSVIPSLVMITIVGIGCIRLITQVEATCLSGLDVFGGLERKTKFLEHSTIRREYRSYPDHLMSEAFEVIDQYLSRELDCANLDSNLIELRNLLGHEIESKSNKGFLSEIFCAKYCIHKKLKSKDRDLMINSLIRLLNLEHIRDYGHECNMETTRELDEANRIAKDPIGRRNRNETIGFGRIDEMVFEAARQRAEICLPVYKGRINGMTILATRPVVRVRRCWNQVLEQRTRRKLFGEEDLLNPKKALNLTARMPNAVEPEEVAAILDVFAEPHSGTSSSPERRPRSAADMALFRFGRYLVSPCYEFIDLVSSTFESLDFDLAVRKFISKGLIASIEHDEEINRVRLFKLMCEDLLANRDQIEEHIKQRDHSRHHESVTSSSE